MYKWVMSILFGVACIVGLSVLFIQVGQHQAQTKQEASAPALPDTPLNSKAAEAIYKQSCIACHGNDLEGKIGPNLQKAGSKLSDQQLYKILQNGRGGMPAFKSTLKEDEIVNLAKWLAEKKMKQHRFKLLVGLVMLLMIISLYSWITQDRPVLPTIKQAPNFTLQDVNGQPYQFKESDGKVRLVEFLFTSCPDICPMTTYNMVHIQNELKKQQLWGNKVQFLSITFDPEHDTPEVFKAYGDKMGMDYSGWTLLTGTEKETADVAKSFGVLVQKLPDDTFVHSVTSLMLVDPSGKIRKIFKMGDEMNNDEIIKMIRLAAGS